jgi:hypothetical protein
MSELDIEKLAEARFEGLDKDTLLKAAEILGCSFPRQTSEKTMRQRLCQVAGQYVPEEEEKPVTKNVRLKPNGRFNPKPDLKNIHSWGGKRQKVRVHKPSGDEDTPVNYLQLVWEGQKRVYAYGIDISLPWPLFQALINCEKCTITQKELKDSDGNLVGIQNTENRTPRYNYRDLGPDPGTEDLPESTLQYWQWEAKKHDNFRDFPGAKNGRRTLIMIRSDLYGPVGPDFYKDMTDEDILHSVLEFLWGDYAEHDLEDIEELAA